MRRYVPLFLAAALLITSVSSCKKAIEQKEKSYIISIMTDGRWYVESYKVGATDVTSEFTGYEFQFYENETVDGIKGTVYNTGTWKGDVTNYTITAAFLPAAGDTLNRLSYTWKLTDSYTNYVEAETTTATGKNYLHLRKK